LRFNETARRLLSAKALSQSGVISGDIAHLAPEHLAKAAARLVPLGTKWPQHKKKKLQRQR
jgi:hypothetical protein